MVYDELLHANVLLNIKIVPVADMAIAGWSTYKLGDDSTIKTKTVLTSVRRLNGHNPDKKPIYSIEADTVVEVIYALGLKTSEHYIRRPLQKTTY
jgi:hypothetical protein